MDVFGEFAIGFVLDNCCGTSLFVADAISVKKKRPSREMTRRVTKVKIRGIEYGSLAMFSFCVFPNAARSAKYLLTT